MFTPALGSGLDGGRKLILGRSALRCYSPPTLLYLLEFTPFKWSEKLMSVAQLGRNLIIFELLSLTKLEHERWILLCVPGLS